MNDQTPLKFTHDNRLFFLDHSQAPSGELVSDGVVVVLDTNQAGQLLSALIQAKNCILEARAISEITGWDDFGNEKLFQPIRRMRLLFSDVCPGRQLSVQALITNTNTTLRLMPNGGLPSPAEPYHVDHARIRGEKHEAYKAQERRGSEDLKGLLSEAAEMFPDVFGLFLEKSLDGTRLPFHRVDLDTVGRPVFPIPIDSGVRPPPLREPKQIALKASPIASLYNGRILRLHNVSEDGWRLGRTRYFDLMEDCDWLKGALLRGWGQQEGTFARRKWLKSSPVVAEWRQRAAAILRGDFSTYLAGMAFNMPIVGRGQEGLEILLAKGSPSKQADAGRRHVCPAGMLEFSLPDEDDIELTSESLKVYMRKELIEETLRRSNAASDPFDIEARIKRLEGQVDTNGDSLDLITLGASCDAIINLIKKENLTLPADQQRSLAAHEALMAIDFETNPFELIVDALVLRPEIVLPIKIDEPVEATFNWENEKTKHTSSWKLGDDLAKMEQNLIEGMSDWAAPGLAGVLIASRQHFLRKH